MKQLEFDTEISGERTIQIPPDLARQVNTHQAVHVVVSVPDGDGPAHTNGKATALMATFGSCKDESLASVFDEIDRTRHADRGRQINIS